MMRAEGVVPAPQGNENEASTEVKDEDIAPLFDQFAVKIDVAIMASALPRVIPPRKE